MKLSKQIVEKVPAVNIQVKVVRTVDWEMLEGLFITACEGGSNYWCKELTPLGPDELGAYGAMTEGFTVVDGESGKKHSVSKADIKKACQLFAEKFSDRFTQSIGGMGDAEDGDIFLQLCVFGEVIYG